MKKGGNTSEDAAGLRRRAEVRLRADATKGTQAGTEADTQRLVHELQVHQIELKMQNEELRQSRAEAEAGFERYTELYDVAPVGYVTLGRDGAIRQMNLTGACLLGVERARLVGRRFEVLVCEPDRAGFNAFLEKVFSSQTKEVCDVALLKQGKVPLNVYITATVSQDGQECRAIMADITDRKRTEELLRESESKYRRLYDSMVDAFACTDMRGRIQETNRAFQILLGYSEEELKQLNYTDLTTAKWHAFESEILKNDIIPHGYSRVYEKEYRKKDGTIFPVELRTFLLREPSGQPSGMCAIIRDITERQQAEIKIKESQRLMDYIIRHDPNAIAVYDENLRYVFVSERYLNDYNVQDRNIIGKHHYEVFPEMPERWKQVHQRVLAGAVERSEDDRFERLDGSVDFNRWECRPWYRLDGSIGGMITYTEVITERKRTEAALRESEARFRTLVERAPDAIFVQSAGRLVYLNSAACRLFGASRPEDLLGKDFMERIAPEYSEKVRERIRLQRETGEHAAAMEQEYLRLDGSRVPVETTAVPIRYHGEDAHIVFVRDITARKQSRVYRELSQNVLQILNEPGDLQDSIQLVLAELKTRTGFDALDIRLQDGDEFQYYAQHGFSKDFLLTENTLIERGVDGEVCRDTDGNICLEGACGMVISGKTDPANPLFTPGGSFWTNDSFPLLDIPPDEDPWFHLRNQCIRQGYASVALIPIRNEDRVVGLIQLNDRRKGCFTLAAVEILEGIASHIGAALMRKQAEESLRKSEGKFRQIVENTNEGVWTIDGQQRVVFVNQRMANMLGYSPEEMIGRDADSFIFEEDLLDHKEQMRRRQRGESAAYERRLLCKDGNAVWTIVSASPIMDAEGRFAGSFGMFTDITERKQAEENLRLSQARYRTLVENIPQRVLLKDRESNYISINQAYARAYGLNPEEVIGKSDYDIHPRNLAEKFRQEDRLVLETGESREFEEENVEDGRKRFLHKVIVPVRDSMGKIIGVLSAISDMTERLQLEEQFRHSQKLEAVGRLAGGVAHDFNNLLTVIGGHTEIALTRIDKNNPLRDNLQEVKISADRASSLTRQLLAFSRRQVMEIKVLNLNTVIQNTEKMLRRLLGEDIVVITQPSENLGLVKADPGQIEQVLTNLAVNARDAMADGGRLVIATDNLEISEADDLTHAGLTPGRYVRISVGDTGHGMNPEVMSKIFEPFFTTKEQGKGTGLGLSTVFGIVKQSGGEIRVHSKPEKGTTFAIMLPRVEEAESVIGKKDLKEPPRGTETVLIIEDEKSVLKMATHILKNQGYQILEAPDSADAMRVFEEHSGPIDLVLTDVVMPVCRGPALVERLKQLRDNFKVLYMSGYTDGGIGDLGVLRRGDNFIQKPFTLESLSCKVRSVLDGE